MLSSFMNKKIFIIDGNNFKILDGFYDEVQKEVTANFKEIGRNLDALNDILRGGFGKFEYGEPIKILWKNSEKSKKDLGFPETIKYFEAKLKKCHPSNKESVQKDLQDAQENKGETLFQIIIKIISNHEHIELEI